MSRIHPNTRKMALIVQEVVEANYESGRQDRSKEWVYRSIIRSIYPMSRRTFFRYLRLARKIEEQDSGCSHRRSLFD